MVEALGKANFMSKAAEFRTKAETTLKGSFFGNMFNAKQDRKDDAKELFQQAANCYKHAKEPEQAVEMYLKCVECEADDGFKANHFKEAALCMKLHDTQRYLELVKQAITLYQIVGRMSQACTMCKDCADKLEEDYNYEQAREFYEQAAELYETENQLSQSNQMLAKWCDLTILIEDFAQIAKVIRTYDKIGKKYLQQALVKSSARDYFFKASLCFLVNDDLQGAKNAIENYTYEDPAFETSRQCEFLKGIVEAIEQQAPEQLNKVVRDNARIMNLDKANSKLLVEIKKKHVPDQDPVDMGAGGQAMPQSIGQLDLVNGGDNAIPSNQTPSQAQADGAAQDDNNGDGFDLC